MGTTAIFAEILIIGLEGLAWIAVFVAALLRPDAAFLGSIAANEALAVLLVVASAYALGVLLDRAADSILIWLDPLVDCRLPALRPDPIAGVNRMRLRLMAPDLGVAPFLEYQRSRVRVARGTVFNLAAFVIAADVFAVARGLVSIERSLTIGFFALANVLAVVVLIVAYGLYRRINQAWLKMLNNAYRSLILEADRKRDKVKARPEPTRVVAAVVHRPGDEGPEFLLVRTKDGCHWTFPKGHVEPDEESRDAVKRELLEEAGVAGIVAREPLKTYLYPPTRRGAIDDSSVEAYLVEFRQQWPADESRPAKWLDPGTAMSRLGQGRSDKHAEEAAAVVTAAVQALKGKAGA